MGNCLSCLFGLFQGNRGEYRSIPSSDSPVEYKPREVAVPPLPATAHHQVKQVRQPADSAPISIPSTNDEQKDTSKESADGSKKFPAMKAGFFIKYDLKEVLGVGSTSTCHRCVRKNDSKPFACKVIDKRQIELKFTGLLEQFYTEVKVLQELSHPNIIALEDVYETSDRIYIVMEMMVGGELFDYVVEKGTLNELEASVIVRKITSAIAHMHAKGVIHRDLKPENLLLTSKSSDAEVKIIDFGLAKVMNEPVAHSFLGTRGYLAPEMLQRHTYDKAIDIWALGVIVFVLLCGCLPFDDDSSRIGSESDARKKFVLRFPRWATSLSLPAKDLLQRLLDVDPKTRFTADQALHHPWVTGKAVAANNYLQSPNMLGKRKKEPMTPHMQAMHNRLMAANGQGPAPTAATRKDANRPDIPKPYGASTQQSAPQRKNSF